MPDEHVPAPRTARREDAPDTPPVTEPVTQPVSEPVTTPVPDAAAAETPETGRRGKRSHPIVPSWEDVLLGTRSPRT
jgi:hypothetical protein